jgi:hypothetical protein
MIVLNIALVILAVFRSATMVTQEEGPFEVFSTLRGKVGQSTWVGRGFHCLLCVSFWLSAFAVLLLPIASVGEFVIYWLGTAGAVLVIQRWLNKP